MNYARKEKFKWIVMILSFVMSAVMFCTFIFGIVNNSSTSTTATLSASDYAIGTIDEESGKILESKKSAYTKQMYDIADVKITLDEETATVTYKVAYYDEDEKFISVSEELSEDYILTAPENAKYFRLVVTPYMVDGEDVSISIFNKSKYVKQLEVIYKK